MLHTNYVGDKLDTCVYVVCECATWTAHAATCQQRRAALCAVPIACDEHGHDVCPICDPCTCGQGTVFTAEYINEVREGKKV